MTLPVVRWTLAIMFARPGISVQSNNQINPAEANIIARSETGESIAEVAEGIVQWMADHSAIVVAFSGGVDSAVVAAAAFRAVGDRAVAVLAESPSVPQRQLELARDTAAEIGVRFETITTNETDRDEYQQNDRQRCFYCKETLYRSLFALASAYDGAIVCSGTNADDLRDYRPGIQAGRISGIQTPLADLGLTKKIVRQVAKFWRLSIWNLPAGPCLASRIAYGEPVTVAKLRMIDDAENWLRDEGFDDLRVRLHPGNVARIEVPAARVPELVQQSLRDRLTERFRSLGFQFITIDIEGLRSGNLNQLVTIRSS